MSAENEISLEPEHWKRPATETRRIYFRRRYMCIARAIGLPVSAVMAHAEKFEDAAFWYEHDGRGVVLSKPAQRHNELQKISCAADRLLKALCFEETADAMGRKEVQKIWRAAERLLRALGVEETADAEDGPSLRVRDLLIYADTVHDDEVISATGDIGRLAEVTQAISAAKTIKRAADEAAVAIVREGDTIVAKGHQAGPLSDWIAALLEIYKQLTGKEPGTSVGATDRRDEGKAGGPLIRFLKAAAGPLRIEKSNEAWRGLIRGVLACRQE